MSSKQDTTIHITGLRMTEDRQQRVHTALMIRLAQMLDGETDDVAIAFEVHS